MDVNSIKLTELDSSQLSSNILDQKLNLDSNYYFLCIIIIAKNEEAFIERCINSCFEALKNFTNYKIILVDSISHDQTIPIAKKFDINIYQLIDKNLLSPAAGRYIGSIYSDSKYVFFIDGDMVLDNDWFKCSIPFLEKHPDIYGIGGLRPDVSEDEIEGYMKSDSSSDCVDFNYVTILDGGACLFKRECLNLAGFHNPFLKSGEEAELSFRLQKKGFKLARINIPMIYHLGITKHQGISFERQKYYIGIGQILRSYGLKDYNISLFKHFSYHIINVFYLLTNCIFLISGIIISNVFLVFFLVSNLISFLGAFILHRKLNLASNALIMYYLKGYYMVQGFIKGLEKHYKYPKKILVIKDREGYGLR